jgi:hypothetical protein
LGEGKDSAANSYGNSPHLHLHPYPVAGTWMIESEKGCQKSTQEIETLRINHQVYDRISKTISAPTKTHQEQK